jgi:hypothetical protein
MQAQRLVAGNEYVPPSCARTLSPRAAGTLFVSLREINQNSVAILSVERM